MSKPNQPIVDVRPEATEGSVRSYTIGFFLSLALTFAAYYLVVHNTLSTNAIVAGVLIFAVAQMIIQLVFFLHLSRASSKRWNVVALLFAVLIVLMVVLGSIWIMDNLN